MPVKAKTPVPDHFFYDLMLKRRTVIIAVLLGLAAVLFLLNISLGSSPIPLGEIFKVLFIGKGQGNNVMIIRDIRLPMSLMALVVGASLGIGAVKFKPS